jgi:Ni,Fe-hydrogenase maturation factor
MTVLVTGRYDHVILIDATPRGGVPGTLYVLRPDVGERPAVLDAHDMTPDAVLASPEGSAKGLGECCSSAANQPTSRPGWT